MPPFGACVVKIRFALSLCILFWVSGTIIAQCNYQGDCVQGICPQPLGPCGSSNDWKDNFFNCCKAKQFEGPICDPCCNIPYFSFSGGYSNLNDITNTVFNSVESPVNVINPGTPPNFNDYRAEITTTNTTQERGFIFDDGYAFTSAIGYRVHKVVRVEAELSFRENDVASYFTQHTVNTIVTNYNNPSLDNGNIISNVTTVGPVVENAATGGVESYSSLFNAYYDFSRPRLRCLNLYLGGGLGLSYLTGDISSGGTDYNINSTSFAYQLIFGANLPLTKRLDLFSDYRFLGMSKVSIDGFDTGDNEPVVTHNVNLGLRYRFGCR